MSIFDFLGGLRGGGSHTGVHPETDTVRKITAALDRLEPERARYLAAFAYILSRAARADLEVDPREVAAMERIVMEQGALPEEQAIVVVQIAKTQSLLFGGTEDYLVTREFNKLATREQKLRLLDCLFAVSASDDSIETVEDNEIRRISQELGLEHGDFIAARLKFRDRLAVLKPPRPSPERPDRP
jgi:uncharacterized tellurite resistance protein B-like protein